jgi:hypothetical protein
MKLTQIIVLHKRWKGKEGLAQINKRKIKLAKLLDLCFLIVMSLLTPQIAINKRNLLSSAIINKASEVRQNI